MFHTGNIVLCCSFANFTFRKNSLNNIIAQAAHLGSSGVGIFSHKYDLKGVKYIWTPVFTRCHIPDDHKDTYERDEDEKRTSLS